MRNVICIFAKPPIPGRTKSRLAKDIGDQAAAALSEALLRDIINICLEENSQTYLFYPPNSKPNDFGDILNPEVKLEVQEGHDLGERMSNCFKSLLSQDYQKVIIVGSDCITLSKQIITECFNHLDESELVIQPAEDGGYVLIAQSTFRSDVFKDIEWGGEEVMEKTLNIMHSQKFSYHLLETSFDIDEISDLKTLSEFVENQPRPFTQNWLRLFRRFS